MSVLEGIANELHRPARKIFPRRFVITRFKDDLWQADLMDMQLHSKKNNGFKYILIVIDTFTKYVWVQALKNKSAKDVTLGMSKILKLNQPKLLQTDNGTEFYNKEFQILMKKFNIKHYSTYTSIKAGMVERVIRTLKNKIYKHFTATGSWNWYNSISKLINSYNNSFHTTIKCSPHEARTKSIKLKFNQEKPRKSKFKINDKVRISKYKHAFAKGYTPNWTTEVFQIANVLPTNPVTYKLKDLANNIIVGCFYEQEIQKTKYPNTFLIERVIKKNKNKILVKWLGFDSSHNSYIDSKDISK
jgi:hypothetical protein